MPAPIPNTPTYPAPSALAALAHSAAPSLRGTIAHTSRHVSNPASSLNSSLSPCTRRLPAPLLFPLPRPTSATRRAPCAFTFTIFASRIAGRAPAGPACFCTARCWGRRCYCRRTTRRAHVMLDLPRTLCQLNPATRLNSFLQSHLDSEQPERAEHISVAE